MSSEKTIIVNAVAHPWTAEEISYERVVKLAFPNPSAANITYAWARLVDAEAPAISFHLLPIEQMGLSEDLYIKMNSRGKPLTPFENFKARFEQVLESSCPERVEEFAQKVDGDWADLLWLRDGAALDAPEGERS